MQFLCLMFTCDHTFSFTSFNLFCTKNVKRWLKQDKKRGKIIDQIANYIFLRGFEAD